MRITKIQVYQVDLPLEETAYKWSDNKQMSTFDTTVVAVHTDAGIIGYGECCPLGANYLPAYANGVRSGLKEIGAELFGENPLEVGKLNERMDYLLKGHAYVKSPLDVACWDILGKFSNLPVCSLIGGRYGESVPLYRAICQLDPESMRDNVLKYKAEGYKKFQLKVGGDPDEDIQRIKLIRSALDDRDTLICDANTGWLPHQAMRIAAAVKDLDVYIEQPCVTYEECLSVRRHTNLPFILDENITSIHDLLQANKDKAADAVNLKISKLGGLSKTKQVRDLCVSLGLAMILEDTWGSDITTAAIAHLAHSTPEKNRLASTDFNHYNSVSVARGGPVNEDGRMRASSEPGLGVVPNMDVLGDPMIEI